MNMTTPPTAPPIVAPDTSDLLSFEDPLYNSAKC